MVIIKTGSGSDGLWFLILGCLLTINDCQSRAVNISNTWTLPQEGYSVFYRFFRDKISWFEADAVCQFHHANLVTVENGIQFDAARAFLKELDVTEFVWIGLMRPQTSHHFLWTNSKPLDTAAGYWADPFPVIEAPLCAVIDPVRDFRWHALRCGGPETAAFLCEMEVPDWATECTVQSMPSLTVQYMSDSGTVELSRDCGEEGTRHMPCRGTEDHKVILNELSCIDVSSSSSTLDVPSSSSSSSSSSSTIKKEVAATNKPTTTTTIKQIKSKDSIKEKTEKITTTIDTISSTSTDDLPMPTINPTLIKNLSNTQKSVIKITSNSIDNNNDDGDNTNNEDNNILNHIDEIELINNKPLVGHKKLIIEDFMLGDQAVATIRNTDLPAAVVKKLTTKDIHNGGGGGGGGGGDKIKLKKVQLKDKLLKKTFGGKKMINKKIDGTSTEEMMMSDQPVVSWEIENLPLPHTKKSLVGDLKHKNDDNIELITQKIDEISSSLATTTIIAPTTEIRFRRETETLNDNEQDHISTENAIDTVTTTTTSTTTTTEAATTTTEATTTTTAKTITEATGPRITQIGEPHPPKITKKVSNSYEIAHKTTSEGLAPPVNSGDEKGFIPPMLLVRTHFSSIKSHSGSSNDTPNVTPTTEKLIPIDVTTTSSASVVENESTENGQVILSSTVESLVSQTEFPLHDTAGKIPIVDHEIVSADKIITLSELENKINNANLISSATSSSTKVVELPKFHQPHAPQHESVKTPASVEPHVTTPPLSATTTTTTTTTTTSKEPIPTTIEHKIIEIKIDDSPTTERLFITTTLSTPIDNIIDKQSNLNADDMLNSKTNELTTINPTFEQVQQPQLSNTIDELSVAVNLNSNNVTSNPSGGEFTADGGIEQSSLEDIENRSDFTNADNFQPYRPNRRRSLTKTETHNYMKKILG